MSLTLLAVVTALVLGHLAPVPLRRLRRFRWYGRWLRALDAQAGRSTIWRGPHGVLLAVSVPVLLVALLAWLLSGWWLGLPGALFAVAVLVYAWGPRDLDVDVEAALDADDTATRQAALARLWPDAGMPRADGPALVGAVFRSALQRWFGVLFWFLLLGPAGALLYRLLAVSAHGAEAAAMPGGHRAGAAWWCAVLNWPVAMLMGWTLALVGNFDAVVGAWRSSGSEGHGLKAGFLDAAASASVRSELEAEAEDYTDEGLVPALSELPELRDAMSLVWRLLLLWLAALALFVIAGWVS
jgi:AmpE protein